MYRGVLFDAMRRFFRLYRYRYRTSGGARDTSRRAWLCEKSTMSDSGIDVDVDEEQRERPETREQRRVDDGWRCVVVRRLLPRNSHATCVGLIHGRGRRGRIEQHLPLPSKHNADVEHPKVARRALTRGKALVLVRVRSGGRGMSRMCCARARARGLEARNAGSSVHRWLPAKSDTERPNPLKAPPSEQQSV